LREAQLEEIARETGKKGRHVLAIAGKRYFHQEGHQLMVQARGTYSFERIGRGGPNTHKAGGRF